MTRALLTLLALPLGAAAASVLGPASTLANLAPAFRRGAASGLRALANLPFDLVTSTVGWLSALCLHPLYRGGPQGPSVGRVAGSMVFVGGAMGHAVSTFAAAFTPTSTIFVSGRAWREMGEDGRDRLLNHELWHARRQFGRWTGWLFWPMYLRANVVGGTHEANPFESGPDGPYTLVDGRWESGYRDTPDYVDVRRVAWLL